jgi:glycerophosphoryl diester phosphodiesterase
MHSSCHRFSLTLPGRPRPYVLAHRGDRICRPENTLAAFEKAIRDGADVLETDLHLSSDDEFICIHDKTIDRTTNGTGRVAELSVTELKRFTAANDKPAWEQEKIPLLDELLAMLPPDRGLAIELKADRFLEKPVIKRLAQLIEDHGCTRRTIVISFRPRRLHACQRFAPHLPTGLISATRVFPSPQYPLLGPLWPILLLNPLFIRIAQRRGQMVCPLDPTPERRAAWYLKMKVDALIADCPALILAALGRTKAQPV